MAVSHQRGRYRPKRAPANIYRVDGNVAYIGMREGYEAKVDLEDLGKVMPFNWTAIARERANKRTSVYVYRTGYRDQCLHRLIMNAPKGKKVDHKNWDGLDNRKENLRYATNSENMQNRSAANRNSKTGVRGVSHFFNGHNHYWGVRVWLGDNHPSGKKSLVVYFPYNESGLQEAIEAAPKLRAEYMTHSIEGP